MNRFSLEEYWDRYGTHELEETEFWQAIQKLPALSVSGPWLCGGAVRRFVSNVPLDSDFDLFFSSKEQHDQVVDWMKKKKAKLLSSNDFNTTYLLNELKIQLIHINYYENIAEVLESFDFSLCKFGFDGEDLTLGDWTLWDVARKRLVPENITYATSTLRRIIKYTNQGFTICSGGLAHILQSVVDNPEKIQQDIEYID